MLELLLASEPFDDSQFPCWRPIFSLVAYRSVMHHSPSIVPNPDDREIYLVLNGFGGRLPLAWCETDEEHTDRETVIIDLIT